MKTTIHFYPNTAKRSKKTGKVPMYLRIIHRGAKAEMRLSAEVSDSDLKRWNERNMRFEGKVPVNTALNSFEQQFERFTYINATTLSKYNAKAIRDIIAGIESKPDPFVLDYVDKFYQKVVVSNDDYEKATKKGYRKAVNHLNAFVAFRKYEDLTLSKVNRAVANEFRDYLLGSFPEIDKKSMKEPSALSNVKKLRTIFDRAISEELINTNPFKAIKLSSQSPRRVRLNIQQVKSIFDLDTTQFPTQRLYKDLFLFSVFTGLAYVDAMALKQTDLSIFSNGEIKLLLKRKKTDIITSMFLPKQAVEIVNRYRNTRGAIEQNSVLPIRSNKEVNVQLKILANMVNLPLKLSTHIARHTFRQLLAEADITEMGVIKQMMGHSSRSDIDGTYYEVTETRLLEAKRKFELFLDKSLC